MVSGRHADQPAAWKRYKNRKKTIRQRHQARLISDAERARLLADAYRSYKLDIADGADGADRADRLADRAEHAAKRDAGRAWLDAHPDREPCGDDSCPAASGRQKCNCSCGGANHGAVHGDPPLVPLHRRVVRCRICKRGFRPTTGTARHCPGCRPAAALRRSRVHRNGSPLLPLVACRNCGLSFRRTSRHRYYCGGDCAAEGARRSRREWDARRGARR